jgi:hypothetical protein
MMETAGNLRLILMFSCIYLLQAIFSLMSWNNEIQDFTSPNIDNYSSKWRILCQNN